MARKLGDKTITQHEAERDVLREVLNSVDEIKAGGRQAIRGGFPDRGSTCTNQVRTFSGRVCNTAGTIKAYD